MASFVNGCAFPAWRAAGMGAAAVSMAELRLPSDDPITAAVGDGKHTKWEQKWTHDCVDWYPDQTSCWLHQSLASAATDGSTLTLSDATTRAYLVISSSLHCAQCSKAERRVHPSCLESLSRLLSLSVCYLHYQWCRTALKHKTHV